MRAINIWTIAWPGIFNSYVWVILIYFLLHSEFGSRLTEFSVEISNSNVRSEEASDEEKTTLYLFDVAFLPSKEGRGVVGTKKAEKLAIRYSTHITSQ